MPYFVTYVESLVRALVCGFIVLSGALPAHAAIELGGSTETYPSLESVDESAETNFFSLRGRLNKKQNLKRWSWGADVEGQIAVNDSSYQYIAPHEAYGSFQSYLGKQPFTWAIGRKRYLWNRLDGLWKLGVWQPVFQWTAAAPKTQGLTGAFVSTSFTKDWHFRGFASGLYIPNQGPSFEVENGQLVSANPWFNPPASQLNLGETLVDVDYDVQIPDLAEIVLQPQLAGQLLWGTLKDGFWAKAAYAYKPMNAPGLAFEGFLSAVTNNTEVSVVPYVNHHHLLSADIGYRSGHWHYWASLVHDAPEEREIESDLTRSVPLTTTLFSPSIEWRGAGYKKNLRKLSFSYLKQISEDARIEGPQAATTSADVFDERYPYFDAFLLQYQGALAYLAGQPLAVKMRGIWELNESGVVLSGELHYWIQKNWHISFGAEVLGTLEEAPAGSRGFIDKNKGNDRIYGGLQYVF